MHPDTVRGSPIHAGGGPAAAVEAAGEESRRLLVREQERRGPWMDSAVRVRIRQRGKFAILRCSPIELSKIVDAMSASKEP